MCKLDTTIRHVCFLKKRFEVCLYSSMAQRLFNSDKSERQKELDSLLVFGYQSKLFQDDEKASFIDSGQHLIPWMGDATVMIDRSVISTITWN